MVETLQPWRRNPLLRFSYALIAPLYDIAIERPMREARRRSLRALPEEMPGRVLVSGVGTGLDLPLLTKLHRYVALDFSPAMLKHAVPRGAGLGIDFVLGDSMSLPFADESFDHAVLHLIVAVVPEPERCLAETARVLKPGGTVVVFDKFLKPRQHAWLRRAFTPLTRRFATRMDVVFEDALRAAPSLRVVSDEPVMAGGWFRGIVLRKG
jgi:ubiquinone/menaquinone biosynthesis C-methylase UbiE